MKQKDVALILVIIFISAIISLFVSKSIFSSSSSRQVSVEAVQPLRTGFPTQENETYFNGGFDPTQLIQVSPNNNTNPFNSSSSQ